MKAKDFFRSIAFDGLYYVLIVLGWQHLSENFLSDQSDTHKLLLGQRPGTLRDELSPQTEASEVTLCRLYICAAEARLQRATASIGVAREELYPDIRLSAHGDHEFYLNTEFSDWSSRTWSVGPNLNLALFDHSLRETPCNRGSILHQNRAAGQESADCGCPDSGSAAYRP